MLSTIQQLMFDVEECKRTGNEKLSTCKLRELSVLLEGVHNKLGDRMDGFYKRTQDYIWRDLSVSFATELNHYRSLQELSSTRATTLPLCNVTSPFSVARCGMPIIEPDVDSGDELESPPRKKPKPNTQPQQQHQPAPDMLPIPQHQQQQPLQPQQQPQTSKLVGGAANKWSGFQNRPLHQVPAQQPQQPATTPFNSTPTQHGLFGGPNTPSTTPLGRHNLLNNPAPSPTPPPAAQPTPNPMFNMGNNATNNTFYGNRTPLGGNNPPQVPRSSNLGARPLGARRPGPGLRAPRAPAPQEEEYPDEEEEPACDFKTARDKLIQDEQIKNNGRGAPQNRTAPSGGIPRGRTPRQGLSKRFQSPLLGNKDNEGNSNKRGGGGGGGSNKDPVTSEDGEGSKIPEFLLNEDGSIPDRLKNLDARLIETICNETLDTSPNVSFDDIAGLAFAKKRVEEVVVWPLLRPDVFTGLRAPPKGLLLFGPPGTGKTMIGKAIASMSASTFYNISSSSLMSKWIGDGEKLVRALFAVASVRQPSVIFIDEIDSLLTSRSEGENDAVRRVKTEFLVQFDGAGTNAEDRILVIGATNRPNELDNAALRRLSKRLLIPLPNESGRLQLLQNVLRKEVHEMSDEDLAETVRRSAGYSCSDMKLLCQEAALGPVRDLGDIRTAISSNVRPIRLQDFLSAFKMVRPSVAEKDLDLYADWNKKYGSLDVGGGED
eukprot:TRINITY_DN62152_c0_g1_i1.p1 TRINITY_DN62152_c0_g1~~TRINITY_DN62152_c0_g1_i1.p1  ORF type:complete len:715 (-),score=84.52 TRINITY_DN62152_c0_g1_i1:1080-3224(-)